jgi:hypothetical protein
VTTHDPADAAQAPAALKGLPTYPRQTEPGYYGPRAYGPNSYAFTAFVPSLFGGGVLSIVLAVIGLGKIQETGQRGRGLAIAAIVIGTIWLPIEIYSITH